MFWQDWKTTGAAPGFAEKYWGGQVMRVRGCGEHEDTAYQCCTWEDEPKHEYKDEEVEIMRPEGVDAHCGDDCHRDHKHESADSAGRGEDGRVFVIRPTQDKTVTSQKRAVQLSLFSAY